MRQFDIDLTNVKKIVYDDTSLDVYLTENNELIIESLIKGEVIDNNFTELDNRLSNVESQIRLRFLGEIQRIRSENEEMSKKINELERKVNGNE